MIAMLVNMLLRSDLWGVALAAATEMGTLRIAMEQ